MNANDRSNDADVVRDAIDAHSRPCRGVPAHTLAGLVAYRDAGMPVGDFLHAVLTNDLSEAVCRADDANLPALSDIVHWVRENLPASAYGSKKNVEAWLEMKETEHDA